MKQNTVFALVLGLLLAGPLLAGTHTETYSIDDAPVPTDGTFVSHCVVVDVQVAKECSFSLRTDFDVIDYLFEPLAGRATIEILGDGYNSSICTVDGFPGETCLGITSMEFFASGQYTVCLYMDAFPVAFIGGNWDELGDGEPNDNPDQIVSNLHHSSTLKQDCGLFVGDSIDQ